MCAFCSYQMKKKQGVRLNVGIHTSLRRPFLGGKKSLDNRDRRGKCWENRLSLSGKQACSLQRTAPVRHTR